MSQDLLKIRNVTKKFGSVTALNNISLEIKNNEMFALLGPSGCGKTTLLRIIAGFEYPDSGQVMINDSDLLSIPTRTRPVNLMFQSYALFPHMDVFSNISYGLTNTSLTKEEIKNQTNEIIEKIGLGEHVKKKPNQLSGGQQQRVALARAIARKPKILLLDEPLSALDKKIRQEMQIELKRIQHDFGITFIIVTHDQDEAISLHSIGAGKPVTVLIRPESINLTPASNGAGQITDAVFAGSKKNITVKLTTNEIVRVYADKSANLEVGSHVNLLFNPQDVRVF